MSLKTRLQSFKHWIAKKWETAEEWLPWFLGITAALVLVVGIGVGLLRDGTRSPASFTEVIADGAAEDASKDTPDEETARGQNVNGMRFSQAASERDGRPRTFVVALKNSPSTSEIQKLTGIPAVRSRAVALALDSLSRSKKNEVALKLELFSDVAPTFQLKQISEFDVNEGMHSGTALDDPNSTATLTTENGMVSGTIHYQGREFRIVADPERGVHYIIEVKRD